MNELSRLVSGTLSRRDLLRTAAVGAAASLMGGTAACATARTAGAVGAETVQDILNATATIERFGVTFLGAGIQSAEQGNFDRPWPASVLAVVKAARAQERFHLDFFEGLGGRALVDTFTIPPTLLTNFNAFFSAIVEQEAVEVAGQIAAFQSFVALGRPDLVKVSFQYAAEEAEHRLLANATRGTSPANDVAFAPTMFTTASAMVDNMRQRGLIGGSGTPIAFPGPGRIDATNVTNRTPSGPAAVCA